MKRLFVGVVILGAAGVLGGCPVYPSDSRYGDSNCDACCTSGNCAPGYSCDPQANLCSYVPTGGSTSGCGSTPDCPGGLTCGSDGVCHSGDCTRWGCPTGAVCELAGVSAQCTPLGGSVDGSATEDALASDATADAVDASLSDARSGDASSTDGGSVGGLCNANADCGGAGSKCIDGTCTPQNRLCADGTQCLVAGDACVDGVCLPRCSAASPGPTGYACDFHRGILSVNPSACKTSAQCQGGAVCVEEHCVAPCAPLDAGAQCNAGLVCVNGGCIPDEETQFPSCQNDGQTGAAAKTCDRASVCLHGECYATCNVSDASSCVDPTHVCKAVTVTTGTFFVCAPPANLGSQCNAAVGSYCPSGALCVDGTCQ